MKALRFSNLQQRFDIEFEEGEIVPGYSDGDFRATVVAQSNGISAASHCWISREEMIYFCKALVELEKSRSGEASLQSMSPNELDFRIYSTSTLGHMSIDGKIQHEYVNERSTHVHSAALGFAIDPSQLADSVRPAWVRTLAL